MDNKNRINDILLHLADAAASAADGVTDAVQNAGQAVSEKYDAMKLRVEINRLYTEQDKLFADIGRMLYMVQAGEIPDGTESKEDTAAKEGAASTDSGMVDAQKTIDRLLLLVDQKQQEIDMASEKLGRLNGDKVCAVCGETSDAKAVYCVVCGTQLKK